MLGIYNETFDNMLERHQYFSGQENKCNVHMNMSSGLLAISEFLNKDDHVCFSIILKITDVNI